MEIINKWYFKYDENGISRGLEMIEVIHRPDWGPNAYSSLDGHEYFPGSKLGDTREECLFKRIEQLETLSSFYYHQMPKEKQVDYYRKSCGKHFAENYIGVIAERCNVCE